MYQPACDLPERGYFFRPTLFTNVAQSHRIAREEIFGPVLSVLTFRTPDEAVEKANNTEYGLSAGVWTEKGSRILWMVRKLKAGVVWANTFNRFDPTSPFGGYKESGFGREGGMPGPPRLRPARGPLSGRPEARREAGARTAATKAVGAAAPAPRAADRPRRRPQDLQAVHRRRSSRGASPAARTWSAPPTARRSRTRSAPRARTCATPSGRRAARSSRGPIGPR